MPELPLSQPVIHKKSFLPALIIGLGIILSACSAISGAGQFLGSSTGTRVAEPVPSATAIPLPSLTPLLPLPTQTATPVLPTEIPAPTSTPLPLNVFTPRLITGISPETYLTDVCQYLQDRWTSGKALPGTVVMPVMYHGVRKEGGAVSDNITVTQKYFEETMQHAKELGFETITIQELERFLQSNDYIPPRSLLLIIDDRRLGTVKTHFLPVLEANQWHLVMAYITGVMNDQEWSQVEEVLDTGLVEVQAHGFLHNGQTYITEFTSEEIMRQEVFNPIETIEDHLGYRPDAFIWPGGNYNKKSVEIAREAGYSLGFTVRARGPVMFNWVPLGDEERQVNDPLLVLPRYWSTAAYVNLDEVIHYADQAIEFARVNRDAELAYFDTYCSQYSPIVDPIQIEEGNLDGNE